MARHSASTQTPPKPRLTVAAALVNPYSISITEDQMNAIKPQLEVELREGTKLIAGDSIVAYMLSWGAAARGETRFVYEHTYVYDGKNWRLADLGWNATNVQEMLATLGVRLQALDKELARLGEISKDREQVRQTIWTLEQLVGSEEKTPAADGIPVWQHVQNLLLSRQNVAMSIPEIMEGLNARKVTLESKTPGESVRTILIRKPDIFERLDGGKFKIK